MKKINVELFETLKLSFICKGKEEKLKDIYESCNLLHFYFEEINWRNKIEYTSFSYNKNDIIKMCLK
jgi:hypothetical protein